VNPVKTGLPFLPVWSKATTNIPVLRTRYTANMHLLVIHKLRLTFTSEHATQTDNVPYHTDLKHCDHTQYVSVICLAFSSLLDIYKTNKIMFKEHGVYPMLSLILFKIFPSKYIWHDPDLSHHVMSPVK